MDPCRIPGATCEECGWFIHHHSGAFFHGRSCWTDVPSVDEYEQFLDDDHRAVAPAWAVDQALASIGA